MSTVLMTKIHGCLIVVFFGQYVIYSRLNDGASDSYGCYLSQYKLRAKKRVRPARVMVNSTLTGF